MCAGLQPRPIWQSPPVRLFHTAMIPFSASSSNGATYNQKNFTAQWNTSASYAPQFSPTSSLNTTLVHTASPPTLRLIDFLHQCGNENV